MLALQGSLLSSSSLASVGASPSVISASAEAVALVPVAVVLGGSGGSTSSGGGSSFFSSCAGEGCAAGAWPDVPGAAPAAVAPEARTAVAGCCEAAAGASAAAGE